MTLLSESLSWWETVLVAVCFPAVGGLFYAATQVIALLRRSRGADLEPALRGLEALNGALQRELARQTALADRYGAQIEELRGARMRLADSLAQLHSCAVAAQAMVHQLERDQGRVETRFPPLPVPERP